MPTHHPLPESADVEQLRRQAKELHRSLVAADPEALARVAAVAPDATSSLRTPSWSWRGSTASPAGRP